MIHTVAPAKINWTLEVVGRRDDGYHDVRTVLQTIELHDEIRADPGAPRTVIAPEFDLVSRAEAALSRRVGRDVSVALVLDKRIPIGAGVGGGASDAAATLRLLDRLHSLGLEAETLAEIAAELGSDVPFFLRGGMALAEGRGERVTPLPDAPPAWIVLVVPPFSLPGKTRLMYEALRPDDFTDGSRTQALAEQLLAGGPVEDALLCNAFERAAYEAFGGLGAYRDWMLEAGAKSVHLCGAGPALFALASGEPEARAIRARMNRARRGERVHAVRTVAAAEATLIWESPSPPRSA